MPSFWGNPANATSPELQKLLHRFDAKLSKTKNHNYFLKVRFIRGAIVEKMEALAQRVRREDRNVIDVFVAHPTALIRSPDEE